MRPPPPNERKNLPGRGPLGGGVSVRPPSLPKIKRGAGVWHLWGEESAFPQEWRTGEDIHQDIFEFSYETPV
jgi:hypothetical protein